MLSDAPCLFVCLHSYHFTVFWFLHVFFSLILFHAWFTQKEWWPKACRVLLSQPSNEISLRGSDQVIEKLLTHQPMDVFFNSQNIHISDFHDFHGHLSSLPSVFQLPNEMKRNERMQELIIGIKMSEWFAPQLWEQLRSHFLPKLRNRKKLMKVDVFHLIQLTGDRMAV